MLCVVKCSNIIIRLLLLRRSSVPSLHFPPAFLRVGRIVVTAKCGCAFTCKCVANKGLRVGMRENRAGSVCECITIKLQFTSRADLGKPEDMSSLAGHRHTANLPSERHFTLPLMSKLSQFALKSSTT